MLYCEFYKDQSITRLKLILGSYDTLGVFSSPRALFMFKVCSLSQHLSHDLSSIHRPLVTRMPRFSTEDYLAGKLRVTRPKLVK